MTTEEKLKKEKEVSDLKREYKIANENLIKIKSETNEIVELKDRVKEEIEVKKEELNKILGEISSEKLMWALERQKDIDDLHNQKSAAQNILNRKAELNEQEEKIRQLEAKEIEARNESRQLELKVQADKDIVNAEFRRLDTLKEEFEEEKSKLLKDRTDYKAQVIKVLKQVDKL